MLVVRSERRLVEHPLARLRVGVAASVLEVLPRDRPEHLLIEPVALVVLLEDAREHRRPEVLAVHLLVSGPRRRPQMRRRRLAVDVPHQLDSGDARQPVAAGLQIGHRAEHRHAARSARRLVTRRGQSREGGMHRREEPAQVPLMREELAVEVADVPDLHVFGRYAGRFVRANAALLQHREDVLVLSREVAGEVGLKPAEHEDRAHALGALHAPAAAAPGTAAPGIQVA